VFNLRNRFFSQLVDAAGGELARRGLRAYVCTTEKDMAEERQTIDDMMARKVGGVILLPAGEGEDFCRYLRNLPAPVVIVSNELPGLPFVGGDDRDAVRRAMEYFPQNGADTVYFVCPPYKNVGSVNIGAQKERAEGYLAYKKEHPEIGGEMIVTDDYMDVVAEILRRGGKRPGIFCSSDHYALKIMKMIQDRGWGVAERCLLMGYDGSDVMDYLSERPASVLYPGGAIGVAAAKMLDEAMEKGEPSEKRVIVRCPLLPGTPPRDSGRENA
jgi:LacI family transcriptional regulator